MFKNTTSVLEGLRAQIRRILTFFGVVMQCLYIFYLVYAWKTGRGYAWANALLLILALAYLVFYVVTDGMRGDTVGQKTGRSVKRAYKYAKLTMRALTLGVTIHGFYYTAANATPGAVILTAFMAIGLVIQIFFEAILLLVERKLRRLAEALKRDTASLRDGFRRLLGRDRKDEKDTERIEYTDFTEK